MQPREGYANVVESGELPIWARYGEAVIRAMAPPHDVKESLGDLSDVRFYPNGSVACWRVEGRDKVQVRELNGKTRERWAAIQARVAEGTQFWFNKGGSRAEAIEPGQVEAFVRVQREWR